MSSTVRDRAVSERIAMYRRRHGLTQDALARKAGLPYGAISGYERGGAIPPERLALVAAALQVSVQDLVQSDQVLELSQDEAQTIRTLRALPDRGRAYIAGLMADLARGEAVR
jgi:transcriptional regulator with XRE-family HTH domain